MKLIQVDKEVLDYLKQHADSRVPNIDYGPGKLKPLFIACASEDGKLFYAANLSSYKQDKPLHQKNSASITRVMDTKNETQCVSIVNHLFAFPLEEANFFELENEDIQRFLLSGKNNIDASKQMNFLMKQLDFVEKNKDLIEKKTTFAVQELQREPKYKVHRFALNGNAMHAKLFEYNCRTELEIDTIEIDYQDNYYKLKVYDQELQINENEALNSASFFDAINDMKDSYELERKTEYEQNLFK